MNRNIQHFARKRRQLELAVQRLSGCMAETNGQVTADMQRLIQQVKALVAELSHVFSRAYLRRVLGGVALVIGVATSTESMAQSFAPAITNPFGAAEQNNQMAWINFELVDMDADGDLDMMAVQFPTDYSYYNAVNLAFQENTGIPEAAAFGPIQAGNPLGLNPLIVNGWDVVYSAGGLGIDVVDLDGDGDFDVIMGARYIYGYNYSPYAYLYESNALFWLENVGTPAVPQLSAPLELNPFGFDLGALSAEEETYNFDYEFVDIDGDGDFDLIGTTLEYMDGSYGYFHRFFWCENTGSATSPAFAPIEMNPFGLAAESGAMLNMGLSFSVESADLDGDGDMDLIQAVYFDAETPYSEVHFFENLGSSTEPNFESAVVNPFGLQAGMSTGVRSVAFGDIDNDGDLDFFANDFLTATYSYGESYTMEFQENVTPASIRHNTQPHSIGVYPNPTAEFIRLDMGNLKVLDVHVLDAQGKEVLHCNPQDRQLHVGHLPSGTYVLRAQTSQGMTSSRFVIL